MSRIETFLDVMPGETRGVVVRNGRPDALIIQRDDDPAAQRLGARSVGRVARVDAGLRGAFVDLGEGGEGFLPSRKGDRFNVGEKIEVEVSAEPREAKGPTLSLIGAATGEVRLVRPGPDVGEILARLAPDVAPKAGIEAIRAAIEAEEDAAHGAGVRSAGAANVSVERTRALIAVDIDHLPGAGRDAARDRSRANREGLIEAARLIRLRSWGGLVAVDLIGVGHEGGAVLTMAREAFGADPAIAYGPVNRFGVMMLSLPWRFTPLEERLGGPDVKSRALAAVRRLRLALAQDTTAPYLILRCPPREAALAAPWVAALGPRARLDADPTMASGAMIDEG